jgi:hypothetical protein
MEEVISRVDLDLEFVVAWWIVLQLCFGLMWKCQLRVNFLFQSLTRNYSKIIEILDVVHYVP